MLGDLRSRLEERRGLIDAALVKIADAERTALEALGELEPVADEMPSRSGAGQAPASEAEVSRPDMPAEPAGAPGASEAAYRQCARDGCAETFPATNPRRRYCSDQCRQRACYERSLERTATKRSEPAEADDQDDGIVLTEEERAGIDAVVHDLNHDQVDQAAGLYAEMQRAWRRGERDQAPTPAEAADVVRGQKLDSGRGFDAGERQAIADALEAGKITRIENGHWPDTDRPELHPGLAAARRSSADKNRRGFPGKDRLKGDLADG